MSAYTVIFTKKDGTPFSTDSDDYQVFITNAKNEDIAKDSAYLSLKNECELEPNEVFCESIEIK